MRPSATKKTARLILVALAISAALAGGPSAGDRENPAGAQASWLSAVERQIADAEYEVTWQPESALVGQDAAWQAPNRAHGFRTYFTGTGIRVIPRQPAEPSWEWALTLVGYGRPAAVIAVGPATLRVLGHRIEYDRGGIIETYVNDRRGLEQGFTLAAPPAPAPDAAPGLVHVELALGGTLSPVISADGQAIDFRTPRGRKVLHYAGLTVRDARARELRARMEAFSRRGTRGVRIVFEDTDAVYPVTIDPLATSAAWTAESDQAGARFGVSVATAGDVNGDGYSDVIVGADAYDNGQFDEGGAFLYLGSAAGLSATAAWTADGDQAGSQFGISVATLGDVDGDGYSDVIVGACGYDNGQTNEGRAYAYHGSAAGLSATAAWIAESDQANALFAISVATSGDVNGDGYSDAIVGAYLYNNVQTDEGRAYVYHGSVSGLATTATWTAESDQAIARFGYAVATAGDVDGDGYADVIVGAIAYDNGQPDEGRAFVYRGSPAGLETTAGWTLESDQAGARFGASVAAAGDVDGDGYSDVIVGADAYDNGQPDEGRAFVYRGSPAGLAPAASWTAESDQAFANLGASVATAGDIDGDGYSDVIIGATFYDNGQTNEGRAFVYHGSTSGLRTTAGWTAESDQADAWFGVSVATAGDVDGDGYSDVLVGAVQYDNNEANEGRASVYHGSAAGLANTAGWTAGGEQANALFGVSVATAGDVDGDGYADVIVGASAYDNGQTDEGRAFVYHGSVAGLAATAAWTAESDQAFAYFGGAASTAGDVDGDGYSDVIVGASAYDNGQTDEGRVFVYHGSASGLESTAMWTAESDQASASFGFSVATAGDVNGDGDSDVIVGSIFYDNGQADEGRAFVYHGSAAGLGTTAAWTAESDQESAGFGFAVATAGDVNGDGDSDVIVGSIFYDNGQADEGRAFVYHGSAAGLGTTAAWTAESDQAGARFGASVATAGDVNGDGDSDAIVGAYLYDHGQADEGRAFVYHGSVAGLETTAAWTAESDQLNAQFGRAVATAGDVNGDGDSDVIVGAYLYDNGQADEGRAFVYHGSAAGLGISAGWTAEGDQVSAYFGFRAATAGDVDGDGDADVIVGAYFHDNGQADEGRAFVYDGNSGPGLSLGPQQRRSTDTVPIAYLGVSDAPDRFRLALLGKSPFGRGRARLEWEVKPLGTPFDGAGTMVGLPQDTGTAGVQLSELATGLLAATPYHWRVRLLHDPATTPFTPQGRWLTQPWNSWQETDLRTATRGAAEVGGLAIAKAGGGQIELSWIASCLVTDTDYAVYEGPLGSFTSHASLFCGTGGATTLTFTPPAGSAYYLIVPSNDSREGSYGTDSAGDERPTGFDACLPQQRAACEQAGSPEAF